jgi:hypothetical protein
MVAYHLLECMARETGLIANGDEQKAQASKKQR